MTRARRFGADDPFCEWIRSEPDLDSVRQRLTVNDVDLALHKYMPSVDAVGTREVQLMMDLEVKTRGAMPSDIQRQTLFFRHQCLARKERLVDSLTAGRRSVWHFGVSVLSLAGLRPDDGGAMDWCRFRAMGDLRSVEIDIDTLKAILRFDLDPDTFSRLSLRRHHKNRLLIQTERTPLGFEAESWVIRKS